MTRRSDEEIKKARDAVARAIIDTKDDTPPDELLMLKGIQGALSWAISDGSEECLALEGMIYTLLLVDDLHGVG